jgi:HEPN domain-containing protein
LKICPNCGKGFPDQYGFCTECGTRLGIGAQAKKRSQDPSKETRTLVLARKDLENAKKLLKAEMYDQAADAADKAVERVLRGWLEQAGIAGRSQPKELPLVFKELKKIGHAVPLEEHIQRVRVLRNRIRHRGYSPKRQEVEAAIGVVEKFIAQAREVEAQEIGSESLKRRPRERVPPRVRKVPEENIEKPIEEPGMEGKSTSGEKREVKIPEKKIGSLEVSWIEFAVGLVIIWVSILAMAVPSILFSVPAEVEEFIPEFFFFVFLMWIGFWVLRRGIEEGLETIGNAPKYSGLAVFVTLMAVTQLRWNSGFSSADPTFWFRVAYLITMAIVGGKLLSMKKARI